MLPGFICKKCGDPKNRTAADLILDPTKPHTGKAVGISANISTASAPLTSSVIF